MPSCAATSPSRHLGHCEPSPGWCGAGCCLYIGFLGRPGLDTQQWWVARTKATLPIHLVIGCHPSLVKSVVGSRPQGTVSPVSGFTSCCAGQFIEARPAVARPGQQKACYADPQVHRAGLTWKSYRCPDELVKVRRSPTRLWQPDGVCITQTAKMHSSLAPDGARLRPAALSFETSWLGWDNRVCRQSLEQARIASSGVWDVSTGICNGNMQFECPWHDQRQVCIKALQEVTKIPWEWLRRWVLPDVEAIWNRNVTHLISTPCPWQSWEWRQRCHWPLIWHGAGQTRWTGQLSWSPEPGRSLTRLIVTCRIVEGTWKYESSISVTPEQGNLSWHNMNIWPLLDCIDRVHRKTVWTARIQLWGGRLSTSTAPPRLDTDRTAARLLSWLKSPGPGTRNMTLWGTPKAHPLLVSSIESGGSFSSVWATYIQELGQPVLSRLSACPSWPELFDLLAVVLDAQDAALLSAKGPGKRMLSSQCLDWQGYA